MKAVVSKWKDFSNQVNQDSSKASIVTIMSKDGKFLLVKRGMTAHWEPGKWGLVGGFIHKGEDPHDDRGLGPGLRECNAGAAARAAEHRGAETERAVPALARVSVRRGRKRRGNIRRREEEYLSIA